MPVVGPAVVCHYPTVTVSLASGRWEDVVDIVAWRGNRLWTSWQELSHCFMAASFNYSTGTTQGNCP